MTTSEVARHLRLNQKKVYAMVAAGDIPAIRVSGKWLFPRTLIEDWLREHTVFPESELMSALLDRLLVLQGSDDWLLGGAIDRIRDEMDLPIVTASVGSLAGVRAIGEGSAHMAGFHVDDCDVERLVPPGPAWYAVTLATREQGLMVRRDDDLAPLETIGDVTERGLRLADRQPEAGTHKLTRRLLVEAGADVAMGIRVAAELCGLDFVPLHEELFKIAVPGAFMGHRRVDRFLDSLLGEFEAAARSGAPGYSFSAVGKTRPLLNSASVDLGG